jgi:hypothetical protein
VEIESEWTARECDRVAEILCPVIELPLSFGKTPAGFKLKSARWCLLRISPRSNSRRINNIPLDLLWSRKPTKAGKQHCYIRPEETLEKSDGVFSRLCFVKTPTACEINNIAAVVSTVDVTKHPTSRWIVQRLRNAFPFDSAPKFLIFDRDTKYGLQVPAAFRSLNISAVQTSFKSPWQNAIAKRWVGSCRRALLNLVIAINEGHLKRLLTEYVRYHHETARQLLEALPWDSAPRYLLRGDPSNLPRLVR